MKEKYCLAVIVFLFVRILLSAVADNFALTELGEGRVSGW
jgi:hypothetical protein